jgi:hypothetical protein
MLSDSIMIALVGILSDMTFFREHLLIPQDSYQFVLAR